MKVAAFGAALLGLMVFSAIVPYLFSPTAAECSQMGPKECRYVWGDR